MATCTASAAFDSVADADNVLASRTLKEALARKPLRPAKPFSITYCLVKASRRLVLYIAALACSAVMTLALASSSWFVLTSTGQSKPTNCLSTSGASRASAMPGGSPRCLNTSCVFKGVPLLQGLGLGCTLPVKTGLAGCKHK